MNVTVKLLEEMNACESGVEHFKEHYEDGISANELLIAELMRDRYAIWILGNLEIEDTQEMRDKITNSEISYLYCRYVKDSPEMRDKITGSYYAYLYCQHVKDTQEMRDKITGSYYAYLYCLYVKDRAEMRDKITDGWISYLYLLGVK